MVLDGAAPDPLPQVRGAGGGLQHLLLPVRPGNGVQVFKVAVFEAVGVFRREGILDGGAQLGGLQEMILQAAGGKIDILAGQAGEA